MAKFAQHGDGKRNVLGWLCLIVFVLFNAAMLAWLLTSWGAIGAGLDGASEPERAGAVIDTTVTTAIILLIWLLGAGLTGSLAYLTRRRSN